VGGGGKVMNRLRNLLRQEEFHVVLFLFGFILLSGPFLGILSLRSPEAALSDIYLIWILLVSILFLISRSYSDTTRGQREKKRRDRDA
jgi:hypothetical protein